MTAAVALIGRTGAKSFQLRYSDDEEPVIWMAVGIYDDHKGGTAAEVGAAITPVDAAFRLCEKLVDGGQCTHCKRPTGITADFDPVPLSDAICWYQFDPELKIFRRSCE